MRALPGTDGKISTSLSGLSFSNSPENMLAMAGVTREFRKTDPKFFGLLSLL